MRSGCKEDNAEGTEREGERERGVKQIKEGDMRSIFNVDKNDRYRNIHKSCIH